MNSRFALRTYAGAVLSCLIAANACAQLEWRVSIKFFTDASGNLPTGSGFTNINSVAAASNLVDQVNRTLDGTGRGYRWKLLEITSISGTTAPLPVSTNSWFNVLVADPTQNDLNAAVHVQPGAFLFRSNAVNFYVTGSSGGPNGGYCSFPTDNQDTILVAQDSFSDVLIHESGHFFGLSHTFGGATCTLGNKGNPTGAAGDDGIADTPPEWPCATQNDIATNAYGIPYASLNSSQQAFVNGSWLNIMSYHSPGSIFTSDQLDVMADTSNGARFVVASGRTRFVDRNGGFVGTGSSQLPYTTVGVGIQAADPGDIVLIRPGNYNEPGTYSKAVTLHATRGPAILGIP